MDLIFSVNFEKAFDKVCLDFIYKCLEYFNFEPSLINWVKVMYSNPNCKVLNNGFFSETIKLHRGLKQGCPISAYLFILAIEISAQKVRANSKIEGLRIFTLESKVSMYADDVNFQIQPNITT